METIVLEQEKDIAVVSLNNGLTNPVGPSLVEDLHTALDEVKNQSKGMVLCGGEKFFCIGLDLPQLLELDRKDMKQFWYRFNSAVLKLFNLPLPTACAIEGHGPGAGAILALACDFRFIADQKALIGFNEIQLNIPAPYIAGLMLRQALSQPDADELLYEGGLIPAEKAKQFHFVSGIFPKSRVKSQAIKKIEKITPFSSKAFAATKDIKTERIKGLFEKNHPAQHEIFLDNWFSDEAQASFKDALKNF